MFKSGIRPIRRAVKSHIDQNFNKAIKFPTPFHILPPNPPLAIATTPSSAPTNIAFLALIGGGAYVGEKTYSAKTKQSRAPHLKYIVDPLYDIPINDKIVVVDNSVENPGFNQSIAVIKSNLKLFGTGGAVSLCFDAKPYNPQHNQSKFSYNDLQRTDIDSSRPLRLSISSTGLSKELATNMYNRELGVPIWNRNQLENFSMRGEDVHYITGEDALVSGHIGIDNDTRYEYVSINKQSKKIILELLQSIQIEEQIEQYRLEQNGQNTYKHMLASNSPQIVLADAMEPDAGRKTVNALIINDQDSDRVVFREKYLSQHPNMRKLVLTDEQKRKKVDELAPLFAKDAFLHKSMPFPVVTPVHSFTETQNKPGEKSDFSSLTAHEVFGTKNHPIPVTTAAVIGVADGVGGMASYGDKNETKEMSHQLMSCLRHSLSNESRTARELLGQAFTSLIADNTISLGACTSAVGLFKAGEPEEPEDEFDDGRRLTLSIANAGDSTIIAFRPKHNQLEGPSTYVPLVMAWPMHHKGGGNNPAPFQFTIYPAEIGRRRNSGTPLQSPPPISARAPERHTTLSTSHFATPTPTDFISINGPAVNGPSGGNHIYVSPKDYRDVIAGRNKLSNILTRRESASFFSQQQRDGLDSAFNEPGDKPWMAQGMDGVTLRRGDVICAFSDGIGDNFKGENFIDDAAALWSAAVGYLHPAIRVQHPATRNVAPFGQNPSNHSQNLAIDILHHGEGYHSIRDILTVTERELAKFPQDRQLKEYDPRRTHPNELHTGLVLPQYNINTDTTITDEKQRSIVYKHQQLIDNGIRYPSTLDGNSESVIMGTLSTIYAGSIVRYSQRNKKVDDMSVVVGVVY